MGLLAIVVVKISAKKAVGVEIDHQSAQPARRNVELNGLSSKIVIRQGSWEVVHEKYDLILANLVPAALFRIGGHIPSRMVDNGKMVISGFANNQRIDVEKFFMKLVIISIDGSSLDGWSALLMEKVK